MVGDLFGGTHDESAVRSEGRPASEDRPDTQIIDFGICRRQLFSCCCDTAGYQTLEQKGRRSS